MIDELEERLAGEVAAVKFLARLAIGLVAVGAVLAVAVAVKLLV